jgi:hypothetical protein
MKQQIDILIEEQTMRLAKRQAIEEGRSVSDLVQDALEQYLRRDAATPRERQLAYQLFCERPMKIPLEQLRHMLEEDLGDQ